MSILLITPPFTQLNTPYPATAYIKGYLKTINHPCSQLDLGIETILRLFSPKELERMFDSLSTHEFSSSNSERIYRLSNKYISSIASVIKFLQNEDPTLAHLICERQFLPEASKFKQVGETEWAFGTMGIRDKARYLATLYLEDLGDFIRAEVDPHFGFSRYAERISMSATSFDELQLELQKEDSYVCKLMLELLEEKILDFQPKLICLSVPFPGNLFAALKCGQWLKQHHPQIKIVMGGGYPNTELRSVKEPLLFQYVDFVTLDDGETPLRNLLEYLEGKREIDFLKRTFSLVAGAVCYHNGSLEADVKQAKVGTPCYAGLPLKQYLSVIQLTNPMHRLWSDGRWNKLTMAHGCYWGKCTFCDISLDYIKNYESSSAELLVDRMEELIAQTGERGFHFVDEAAPPALMKAVALEILRRELVVTWWTNIRFEKSFSYDLCRVLAASGCVAVSGGLEVASDRLLQLIAKGVTVEQVTKVNNNFTRAGIMVHAYLMYGFPTQTAQETIDSLEVVRQMFEEGVLQSAFWHRFAMTAHSPVGLYPEKFSVSKVTEAEGSFANNDLEHLDPTGADHGLYSAGLKKSLYNYMHGVCLDHPLQNWFEHEVPDSSHPKDLISSYLSFPDRKQPRPENRVVWIGGPSYLKEEEKDKSILIIESKSKTYQLETTRAKGKWLEELLQKANPLSDEVLSYAAVQNGYEEKGLEDFTLFWYEAELESLREIGLLIL